MKKACSLTSCVAAIGLSIAVFIPSASAANNTWNNGTSDWALGTNWSEGSAADAVDVAVFSSVDGNQTIYFGGNQSVQGLSFTHLGSTTFQPGTPSTSSLTVGSSGVSVTAGGAVLIELNVPVILSANQTWANSGVNSLRTLKALDTGGFTITMDGASTTTIIGSASGAGGFIQNGTAVLALYGANTFSGGVVVNTGSLRVQTTTSLGSGTLTINGGSIGTQNLDAVTASNTVEVNGNFSYSSGPGLKALTLSGPMDLNGATRTITQNEAIVDAGGHQITGVISNGGIVKAGNGTLTLGGANTYTGDTTVSAGTLILADDSQSAFTIGANGVNNQFNGAGTLTLNGDFSFNLSGAGTTLGDSWNIVDVGTLAATFGSTFSVVGGFTEISGTIWEITNVNGGRTYQFDESSGILAVTAVPEPSTWALLAGSLTVVMVMRRRNSRA